MENENAESGLWGRARDSDGDAFAVLFDLHKDRVYRRALGLLGNAQDAEDVAAAAFFELWRRRRSVNPVAGSILPWLLVTTVNMSRNVRRSTARYQRILSTLPRVAATEGPDVESLDTRQRIAFSLQQLSPVDGTLFVLTVLEDIPISQAAEAVGLKPATARMRLLRTRARLRNDLNDLNPTVRPAMEGNQI